jgi:hypothetical protein
MCRPDNRHRRDLCPISLQIRDLRYADRTIDKAFLIAQPMRKADWTRRFAAGWGSAGMPMAIVEGNQTVRSALARENDREITPGARSGIVTASFGA